MKARKLLEDSSYGPDKLKIIYKAFDDAWNEIAANLGHNPLAIGAARLKLANIILGLSPDEIIDPDHVKNVALRKMAHDL
jgi:hypothetical protein